MGGTMRFEPTLMWTTVDFDLDGLVVRVRGELSSATAPALDSLLRSFSGTERLASLDLRDADVIEPAAERFLERWPTTPGDVPHTYRFRSDSDGRRRSAGSRRRTGGPTWA
jgi:hypothetical protein